MNDVLMDSCELGSLKLRNRVVMAPLTRSRAGADGVPTEMMAEYYAQRATAGMIISEATNISAVARGFADTPNIYTEAHVRGWRRVTNAVHAAGGLMVCQLWHTGRVSHIDLHPGQPPVSSVTGKCDKCMVWLVNADGVGGRAPASPAVALDAAGILQTVADYAHAARMAKDAGFDGVEIHGANGYLLHQFLASGVNSRDDAYGGDARRRAAFMLEVVDAVSAEWLPDRIGVRLSPLFRGNGIVDPDPVPTFEYLGGELAKRGLAYVHLADTNVMMPGVQQQTSELLEVMRGSYVGPLVLNGGFDAQQARDLISAREATAVAFGRPFIANPDLVARFGAGADLTTPDPATFYGGGAAGYTDYPTLQG